MGFLRISSWLMILSVIAVICFILQLTRVKENVLVSPYIEHPQPLTERLKNTKVRFEQRYHILDGTCQSFSPKEKYNRLCSHVIENQRLGLSWCYVPKTGTNFWKKVFHILQNREKGNNSLRLSDIGFRQAHYTPLVNLCRYSHIEDMVNHMSEQKTLLIVRNPYSRLFSAYIDKFLLPDHWSGVGRYIVKHYRKNS